MGSSAGWQRTGVFFDTVSMRFVDADADRGRAALSPDADVLTGLEAPVANSGTGEFTFMAPIPGCGGPGIWDGKANPMIVYRMFPDSNEPLN